MKQSGRSGLRWSMLVLAFLCLAATLAPVRRIASSVRHAFAAPPLFENRKEGYHCFRIPAIVQMPDGTLLAFAEARKSDCSDFGDVRIVMRSHDEGKSWSALQAVASNGTQQAGNPVLIVDSMDPRYPQGRLFLVYNTSNAPEDAVREGHGTMRVWYRTSTDNGAKWESPVEITGSVKRPSWRYYGVGPGHGLQLGAGQHKGRIFVPGYHTEGPPQPHYQDSAAHSFFSDDHGRTWTLGAAVARPGSNESTAVQIADGSIVMNSRDEGDREHARVVSISKSDGERWDETFVARDLPDPACEGSMVRYAAPSHKPVLLFSNLSSTNHDSRRGLTISESQDGGRTWPKHTVIYEGSSAYSDLVVMPGGRLGILWERGDDGIVFETRVIDDLF